MAKATLNLIWTSLLSGVILALMNRIIGDFYSKKLSSILSVGNEYSIYDIADLYDCDPSYIQQRGGLIPKASQDACLLMITFQKTKKTNPYSDKIIGNTLFWDSPKGDPPNGGIPIYQKYIENGYKFFVFVHDDNRLPYIYQGRAYPLNWEKKKNGLPARVSFLLYDYQQENLNRPLVDEVPENLIELASKGANVPTTKDRVVKTRTVQNKFRRETLDLWNHRCAVSSVDDERILIASHIKPWCNSDDSERVDPYNGLILNPTYDKLFDLAFISFSPDNGKIKLSDELDPSVWDHLMITGKEQLTKIPPKTADYLEYHYRYRFNMTGGTSSEDLLVI